MKKIGILVAVCIITGCNNENEITKENFRRIEKQQERIAEMESVLKAQEEKIIHLETDNKELKILVDERPLSETEKLKLYDELLEIKGLNSSIHSGIVQDLQNMKGGRSRLIDFICKNPGNYAAINAYSSLSYNRTITNKMLVDLERIHEAIANSDVQGSNTYFQRLRYQNLQDLMIAKPEKYHKEFDKFIQQAEMNQLSINNRAHFFNAILSSLEQTDTLKNHITTDKVLYVFKNSYSENEFSGGYRLLTILTGEKLEPYPKDSTTRKKTYEAYLQWSQKNQ
ncbi:MAG: hypothetical protein MK193_05230 [Lentisphaeria bacterium]|nr:hypothetical protein [Lentisphaeria bacterium]